jgi:hypothetical protein
VVDGIVNAIAGLTKRLLSPLTRALQTGLVQNYALVMVLGLFSPSRFFFFHRRYSDGSARSFAFTF